MFNLQEKIGQRWIVAITEFGLRRPTTTNSTSNVVDILITGVQGMRLLGTDPQGNQLILHGREVAFVGQIS